MPVIIAGQSHTIEFKCQFIMIKAPSVERGSIAWAPVTPNAKCLKMTQFMAVGNNARLASTINRSTHILITRSRAFGSRRPAGIVCQSATQVKRQPWLRLTANISKHLGLSPTESSYHISQLYFLHIFECRVPTLCLMAVLAWCCWLAASENEWGQVNSFLSLVSSLNTFR